MWWNTVFISENTCTGGSILWYIVVILQLPVIYVYIATMLMYYIHYLIPAVIVFMCMFRQMYDINRTLQSHANNGLDSARHVNITIGMICVLFFVCNATFSIIYTIALFGQVYIPWTLVGYTQYTLPLVNALFYPLIMILRKQELRNKFKNDVLCVWYTPGRVCRRYGRRLLRKLCNCIRRRRL